MLCGLRFRYRHMILDTSALLVVGEAEGLSYDLVLQVQSCRLRKLVILAKAPVRQDNPVSPKFDLRCRNMCVKRDCVTHVHACAENAVEAFTSWC